MARKAAGVTLRVLGRAKVNLALCVRERRQDGYHELETVMQTVDLADELSMQAAPSTSVSIAWAAGLAGALPASPDLVERALSLVRDAAGRGEAAVRVVKRIPMGAGLGGGSADAAAALVGMQALLGEGLRAGIAAEIALRLGSDVPFAMRGGTAVARGRGEALTPVGTGRDLWWVLGIPPFRLGTAEVYRRYDEIAGHRAPAGEPETGSLVAALESEDPGEVARWLSNDLEVAAFDLAPSLSGLKEAVARAGALGAVMSGSGSAIAGLCRDRSHAAEVAQAIAPSFDRVETVGSTRRGAEVVERSR